MKEFEAYLIMAFREFLLATGGVPYLQCLTRNLNLPANLLLSETIVFNLADTAITEFTYNTLGIAFTTRFNGASYTVGVPHFNFISMHDRDKPLSGLVFVPTQMDEIPPTPPPHKKPTLSLVQ
jgi:stringent starvation protein B